MSVYILDAHVRLASLSFKANNCNNDLPFLVAASTDFAMGNLIR